MCLKLCYNHTESRTPIVIVSGLFWLLESWGLRKYQFHTTAKTESPWKSIRITQHSYWIKIGWWRTGISARYNLIHVNSIWSTKLVYGDGLSIPVFWSNTYQTNSGWRWKGEEKRQPTTPWCSSRTAFLQLFKIKYNSNHNTLSFFTPIPSK